MMRSFRWRLVAGMLGGLALLLGLFGFGVYEMIHRALAGEFDASLAGAARTLAATVEADDDEIEIEFDADQLPEFVAGEQPGYFQFWLEGPSVLRRSPSLGKADLPRFWGTIDQPAFREMTLPNGRTGRAVGIRFAPADEDEREQEKHRAPPGPRPVTLVVARDTVALEARLASLRWLLMGAGAGAMAAAMGVSLLVARGVLRPLNSLAGRIADIKTDDLSCRIGTGGMPTEIEPVARKLDDLLARLEAAFNRERAFTANVAHELRTPLAGVRSTIEVALSRARGPAEYREALADCLAIAGRMQSMTANLLALARLEAGQEAFQFEQVNLRELVTACWGAVAEAARSRGIVFEGKLPAGLSCTSSREGLSTVMRNLLDNAVEYADEGGRIEVTHAVTGDSVEIAVSNTGCGLSPEDVSHVFDRFWRGDRARTQAGIHCGLGLTLVQRCVEALGGAVSASVDAPGVFTVRVALGAAA